MRMQVTCKRFEIFGLLWIVQTCHRLETLGNLFFGLFIRGFVDGMFETAFEGIASRVVINHYIVIREDLDAVREIHLVPREAR